MSSIAILILSMGGLVDKLNSNKYLGLADWVCVNRNTIQSNSKESRSINLDPETLNTLAQALSSDKEQVTINSEELISQPVEMNHLATVCNQISYKGISNWVVTPDCKSLVSKGGKKIDIDTMLLDEVDKSPLGKNEHSEFLTNLSKYVPLSANENISTV